MAPFARSYFFDYSWACVPLKETGLYELIPLSLVVPSFSGIPPACHAWASVPQISLRNVSNTLSFHMFQADSLLGLKVRFCAMLISQTVSHT